MDCFANRLSVSIKFHFILIAFFKCSSIAVRRIKGHLQTVVAILRYNTIALSEILDIFYHFIPFMTTYAQNGEHKKDTCKCIYGLSCPMISH